MKTFPREYEFTRDVKNRPPMNIDDVHWLELLRVIGKYLAELECWTGEGYYKEPVFVEIGAHRGFSTAAFVEAFNTLQVMTGGRLHIVEPFPTPELLRVIGMARDVDRVILHRQRTCDGLPAGGFYFLDGDHGAQALADLAMILARCPDYIVLHDTMTASAYGMDACQGAAWAGVIMRESPGYEVIYDDCEKREGVWTDRGMLIARRINPMEEEFP